MTNIAKRCHRIICHPTCNCEDFKLPSSARRHYGTKLYIKASNDPKCPLHSLIPKKLSRSGKFAQPFCATEKRKKSFVPRVTEIINSLN